MIIGFSIFYNLYGTLIIRHTEQQADTAFFLTWFRSHCNPTPIPTAKLYLKSATSSVGHENYHDTLQGFFMVWKCAYDLGGGYARLFQATPGYNCFCNLSLFFLRTIMIRCRVFSWSGNAHMIWGGGGTLDYFRLLQAIIAFAISVFFFFAFQKTLYCATSATAFH